ncbi:phosphodiester glycosidase family protein [Niallia endozanthoxylica]|uniref:phosphodiester glycosidase family protein n=1 Tax=Niallia endozanthoxylica TaxID=2036016 RepID=UPI001CC42C21|nr:phosphodiester glycosidase family protein [Niallia endozanthoxylica]
MRKEIRKRRILAITFSAVLAGNILTPLNASALGSFDLHSAVVQTAINEYEAVLAPGVTEKHYTFEGKDGKKIESFVIDIDRQTPNLSIEAGTPNDGTAFGLQPVQKQATSADRENHRVVAAVNADFFYFATGEPVGIVHKNGQALKTDISPTHYFFGITKSGEALIGGSEEYEGVKDQLQEALGGNAILVKDSQVYQTPKTGGDVEPRTAVGIKADGDVFFAVIDGRQEPYSSGISMPELAQLMIDLGAVTALNLDGGGSSTFITRELDGNGLELDNSPSDRSERSVANSWLIVNKAPSDQVFHNAHIEPYDQSFTPGSTIQFSAKGRDQSYASASLPATGLTWAVEDPSFGTINENGTFVSSGKTGQFHVLLNYQGTEVGRSIIEVENPDHMYFSSQELTLARNSEMPLNLTTQFQKRNVKWNPQDIEFDIPAGLGTIDENGILHTGNQSVTGTITARLKGTNLTAQTKVSVGRSPEVLFNFEESLGSWKTSTANRGETSSVHLASAPAPVQNGSHALGIDFDFTKAQTGATLGVYAGPGKAVSIDGEPTSIGMWVYGTPEAQGYWLRMMIVDGNGTNQTLTLASAINWTGWKYVKADIPAAFTGPFKLHGTQAIRLMSTNSGTAGPMTKGSLYVDNIRAVYGEDDGGVEDDGKEDGLEPSAFTDVNERYAEAVNYLHKAEIVQGFSSTEFGTYQNITRGDAAVIMARLMGYDTENAPDAGFTDLNPRVKGAVNALAAEGIVSGVTSDRFAPHEPLSRGAVAKILALTFDLTDRAAETPFTDVNGSVFEPYIEALYGAEITAGRTITSYGTHEPIMRGDFANLLFKSYNYSTGE